MRALTLKPGLPKLERKKKEEKKDKQYLLVSLTYKSLIRCKVF